MFNRNLQHDAVLETKRNEYLAAVKETRDDLINAYKLSISKTKYLHANLLFTTTSGRLILKGICRYVTCVKENTSNTDWKDIAVKLGYSDVDIKCINNLNGNVYAPIELALQYYAATNKEATVAVILQALLDLGFLPALNQANEHIDDLLTEIESGKPDLLQIPLNIKEQDSYKVLKATNFNPYIPTIFDPVDALKTPMVKIYSKEDVLKEEVKLQQKPQMQTKPLKQYCKYVMLTFASDGFSTAKKIASVLRTRSNKKGLSIGVLMLHENDDQIQRSSGRLIPSILSKMDYVVPVLTEGYFIALNQPNIRAQLLDERYIQFIYDILISKYIYNQCVNIQVRPIIPRQAMDSILSKQEFIHNSMFTTWRSSDEITDLADSIISSNRNQILSE